jgi:4-alpha-glucanotransferase
VNPAEKGIIEELAALLGIEPEYYDNWGRRHETSPETKAAIIRSMGIEDPRSHLSDLKLRPWNRFIEPVMVVSVNRQPSAIPVYLPLEEGKEGDANLTWYIEDESGGRESREFRGLRPVDSTTIGDVRHVRVDLPNEANREMGYYTLHVTCTTPDSEFSGKTKLIVTPDRCYLPEVRTWGISISLYSIRSTGNWGMGDLSDLKDFISWTARELGGDFVGINPLHAIPNRMPYGISPYSPTSRLYRNCLYIDVENELKGTAEGKKLLKDPDFTNDIAYLKDTKLIDYERAALVKKRALRAAFSRFKNKHIKKGSREAEDFRLYMEEEGRALENFATFMALEEHLRAENQGLYRWQDWPAKYRSPDAPAVEKFRKDREDDVLFYKYVQWLMERQLREVRDASEGMRIGIYQDLALGSLGEGSDAWSCPDVFSFGVTAGAPPDAFNLNGQDWGIPPFIPHRLRESGYELFMQTIRKNLKYSGALRIDHALGLFRLFFIPQGMSPKDGTYVRYPAEDLLRIICLESVRNRAVIIAEDLGTIGEEVREALFRFGMLSYRLFYFERDWNTFAFLPPHAYPEKAFTAVTTHDLPTIYGYWAGRDIEAKKDLGLYPDEEARNRDAEERKRDKQLILDALNDFLPEGFPRGAESVPVMTPELSLSIHRSLARTPCMLVSTSLDDAIASLNQQNMPGTIDSHPNWRQKTPLELGELFDLRNFRELARMFGEESRGRQI